MRRPGGGASTGRRGRSPGPYGAPPRGTDGAVAPGGAAVSLAEALTPGARLIQVSPMGNVGNRMIQYLAALALASRVPDARVVQIHLPEWGIQIPPVPDNGDRTEVVTTPAIELDRLAAALRAGALDRVDVRTYAQRVGNFLLPAAYRELFPAPAVQGTGEGELLCNIRQGDILDARHPDYVLLPIEFYADLTAQTGLAPVFMGQLDESVYLHALRARFPAARYLPSQGPVADFACIRASRHIVPAVSTFSWLAAWLSEAQTIHLPVAGLFNPAQARSTDLVPLDDPRYRFIAFPHHYAVPVACFAEAHAAIRRLWREMRPDALRALLSRTPPQRDPDAYLAAYDEVGYLLLYRDVAGAVTGGHMPDGRHHFVRYGFAEGRLPFLMDGARYCTAYPIAAIELAQGEAWDPADHWIRFGRERGYQRFG